jgi:hypothetical protein
MARSALIVLGAALASVVAAGAGAFDSSNLTIACPRLADAASLPLRPGGSPLRADVNGDGRRDSVTVRYAPRARASCGFVLVVRTAPRVLAVRVPEWYKPPQDLPIRDWPFPEPYLGAAVKLAAARSQIVVARRHGASIVVVSLYGLANGKLSLLRFHPHRNQLSLFGTVGTGVSNAPCIRGGPLTVLSTWPSDATGARWTLRRSDYRLANGGFQRINVQTNEGSRRKIDALAHRRGMDELPFTGCVVARGRRL